MWFVALLIFTILPFNFALCVCHLSDTYFIFLNHSFDACDFGDNIFFFLLKSSIRRSLVFWSLKTFNLNIFLVSSGYRTSDFRYDIIPYYLENYVYKIVYTPDDFNQNVFKLNMNDLYCHLSLSIETSMNKY